MTKHRPRRRFSQNFLVDQGIIAGIVASLHATKTDHFVEIGPGLGALTRPLLAAAGRLDAIEIDRDLAARLRAEFAPALTLHVGDVLAFDFFALGENLRVIGNLPYHVSTPVLFHLASFASRIQDIHVMLQEEVVARMIARPSDSNYGRLSVMLQYRFALDRILDVDASAFDPAPEVQSAVVRLTPLHPLPYRALNEELFARIVQAAFSQRRKTLRNSLEAHVTAADFDTLGIDPTLRAQNLPVAQFVALANHLSVCAA